MMRHKREQHQDQPGATVPPAVPEHKENVMRITEQERNAMVMIEPTPPAGQPPLKVKRKAIAQGNLDWLRAQHFIDGDYNFTKTAEEAGVVKVKVLKNTSEFGRGVRGQIMYVPTVAYGDQVSAKDKRFKGDFEF
jgi:hypothetical protein